MNFEDEWIKDGVEEHVAFRWTGLYLTGLPA